VIRFFITVLVAVMFHLPARADVPRPVVEVFVSGAPDTLRAMSLRIRSIALRLPVTVNVREQAQIDLHKIVQPSPASEPNDQPKPFVRVWLDLSQPTRAFLFIEDTQHDRFLVRAVPNSSGDDELMRESLATVIESAVDALSEGAQLSLARDEAAKEIEAQTRVTVAPPSPITKPSAPAPLKVEPSKSTPKVSRYSLHAALHYRGDAVASDTTLRNGAQLALWGAGLRRPSFDLLLGLTGHTTPCPCG
jgi:hypothetical protein